MTGWTGYLAALARETLRDPRGGIRALLALDPPREARWLALLLVAVLSVLTVRLTLLAMPAAGDPGFLLLVADPMLGVPAQALSLVVAAAAIAIIGQRFGGRGSFADALLTVVWIEFLMVLAQAAELMLMLAVPFLGGLMALAVLALALWITVNAVAELHGFQNLLMVFFGLALGFAGVVLTLATVFAALGIFPVL